MPLRRLKKLWETEGASHLIGLLALFIIGTAFRFIFLFQPLCHDEAVNYIYFAAHPLSFGLSHYPYPNNHLFNTLLEFVTTRILGDSVWSIRLPAFIVGILMIPIAYLVFRKLFNRDAALLGTAFVVSSSQLIEYSTNARGFSIQALAVLLLVLTAAKLLDKESTAGWFWFVLLSSAGFYAVPTMLYFFAGIVLWLFLSAFPERPAENRLRFVGKLVFACVCTAVVVFLAYLPVIITSGFRSLAANEWVKALPLFGFVKSIPSSLKEYWLRWNAGINVPVAVVIAGGFIASLVFYGKTGRRKVNPVYPLFSCCFAIVLLQRRLPPARAWLPLLPIYLGFAAVGLLFIGTQIIDHFRKKRSFRLSFKLLPSLAVIIALGLGLSVIIGQSPYQPDDQVCFRDAEKVAFFLKHNLKNGDIVFVEPNVRKPLEYYFGRFGIPVSYMYRYPEDIKNKYEGVKRAYVIDAAREGKIYDIDHAMSSSNLKRGVSYSIQQAAKYPFATIYLIKNPEISENNM